jgi:Uncharacterized protein conserved in bacteria
MILKENIERLTINHLASTSHFLVDVCILPGNNIEVCIDDANGIQLDDCVALSRAIEAGLDRDKEDFSLTVTSAGLDQALKVFPQYLKFVGKEVALVLRDGKKCKGILTEAQPESITIMYSQMETVEGKKRKQKVEHQDCFLLSEVKSTKPVIHF